MKQILMVIMTYSKDPIKSTVLIAFRAEKIFMYGTYNRVLLDIWQTVLLIVETCHFKQIGNKKARAL